MMIDANTVLYIGFFIIFFIVVSLTTLMNLYNQTFLMYKIFFNVFKVRQFFIYIWEILSNNHHYDKKHEPSLQARAMKGLMDSIVENIEEKSEKKDFSTISEIRLKSLPSDCLFPPISKKQKKSIKRNIEIPKYVDWEEGSLKTKIILKKSQSTENKLNHGNDNDVADEDNIKNGVKSKKKQNNLEFGPNLKSTWIEGEKKGKNEKMNPTILYIHGGGYISGEPEMFANSFVPFVHSIKGNALMINYRLCPEYSILDSVIDIINGYIWLIKYKKINPKQISIIGESAGGGLAVLFLQTLRDKIIKIYEKKQKIKKIGEEKEEKEGEEEEKEEEEVSWISEIKIPSCLYLNSPWIDLTRSCDSHEKNKYLDVYLKPGSFEKYMYHIKSNEFHLKLKENDEMLEKKTGKSHNYLKERLSGLFQILDDFPSTFISVGFEEVLYGESVLFGEKLKEVFNKNKEVKKEVIVDSEKRAVTHCYPVLYVFGIKEAKDTINQIKKFILKHTQ